MSWLRWLWWALRGRCLTCGRKRRVDTQSYGCFWHHGVWKRCVRCERWHKDNEPCPPSPKWPSGGSWSEKLEEGIREAKRRGLS